MGCEYDNKANTRVTVDDVIDLFRPLEADEIDKAGHLLKIVEDQLLLRAFESGKNLDERIDTIPGYRSTFKSVVVDIVARNLMTATSGEPMASYSESALGYSFSGTFLNPGGGLFIKDAEYKKLGFIKQKIRGLEIYGPAKGYEDTWDHYHSPRPGDPWY
mgnify:FL=1